MKNIDYKQEFADNLRKYREAAALTLDEVAYYSGISASVWSGYENKRGNPTIDTLARISETLSVPVRDLLEIHTDYPERHVDLKIKTLIKDINKLDPTKRELVVKIIRSILLLIKACS